VIKRIAIAAAIGTTAIGLFVSLGLTPSASANDTARAGRGVAAAQAARSTASGVPDHGSCGVALVQRPGKTVSTDHKAHDSLVGVRRHSFPSIPGIRCGVLARNTLPPARTSVQ
jgi:hypothetical protein